MRPASMSSFLLRRTQSCWVRAPSPQRPPFTLITSLKVQAPRTVHRRCWELGRESMNLGDGHESPSRRKVTDRGAEVTPERESVIRTSRCRRRVAALSTSPGGGPGAGLGAGRALLGGWRGPRGAQRGKRGRPVEAKPAREPSPARPAGGRSRSSPARRTF